MHPTTVPGIAAVLTVAAMCPALARAQLCGRIESIDGPAGAATYGFAVSADGTLAAGAIDKGAEETMFRWSASRGLEDLGCIPGYRCGAQFISRDNSVLVGYAKIRPTVDRVFRWTDSSGFQDIGSFGASPTRASAISADGSVIVGYSENLSNQYRAFRWTQATGIVDLGTFGGGRAVAEDVSEDGNVVVGRALNASDRFRAFRWTPADGLQNLGTLGGAESEAHAVSADGSVIVGWSTDASGRVWPFRWTAQTGMQSIGSLISSGPIAYEVSADGSTIVAVGLNDSARYETFRWSEQDGMIGLGVGGNFVYDYGVSDDGSTIVGRYFSFPDNKDRAYRWSSASSTRGIGPTTGLSAIASVTSADGRAAVGSYRDAERRWHAFRWGPCPADFVEDCFIDFFDYAAFVACYEAGECPVSRSADVNADGFVDLFDYADFVQAFESGC
ncbi:MAG: hypothetical protein HEQ23_12605 [Tepidisphaera sp.]